MKNLSMTQFKEYCEEHAGAIFIYDSRNDKVKSDTSNRHIKP